MKNILLIPVIFLVYASIAYSQDGEFQYYQDKDIKTLLGKNRHGGKYGAITLGYSGIDGRKSLLLGQKVTWLPARTVGIGMGINEFITEYRHDQILNEDIYLLGGYGGIYIEPIILPRLPIHASFPILLGAGGLSQVFSDDEFMLSNVFDEFQTFLVVEPGIEAEMNVTKSLRLAAGISYRYTTAFELKSPEDYIADIESLRSVTLRLVFKFGRF